MADRSRMNREVHVRSLWGAGGETPPAYSTKLIYITSITADILFLSHALRPKADYYAYSKVICDDCYMRQVDEKLDMFYDKLIKVIIDFASQEPAEPEPKL